MARLSANIAQATGTSQPYDDGVAAHADTLTVPVPNLRALRWFTDELYVGMKEAYAVGLVEAGRSTYWSVGRVWESSPGSLQIQQPGDVHRDLTRDGPSAIQIFSLSPELVEDVVGKVRVHAQLEPGDERGSAFRRLHDAIREGTDGLAVEVCVVEAIEAFGGIGDGKHATTKPVRRAMESMRDHLGDALTLDELAAHAGLDKFHLCRAFRAQVGMPPHAYLTRLRIMRAKHLLGRGVKPGDVALQVGLYDQSQLNRHFRRLVGITPGQFARDARQ